MGWPVAIAAQSTRVRSNIVRRAIPRAFRRLKAWGGQALSTARASRIDQILLPWRLLGALAVFSVKRRAFLPAARDAVATRPLSACAGPSCRRARARPSRDARRRA